MNPEVVAQAKSKARDYFETKGTRCPRRRSASGSPTAFRSARSRFSSPSRRRRPRARACPASGRSRKSSTIWSRPPAGAGRALVPAGGPPAPGEPIPASLQSKVAAPPAVVVASVGARRVHGEILRTLAAVPADFATDGARADRDGGERAGRARPDRAAALGRGPRLEGLRDRLAPARDRSPEAGSQGARRAAVALVRAWRAREVSRGSSPRPGGSSARRRGRA